MLAGMAAGLWRIERYTIVGVGLALLTGMVVASRTAGRDDTVVRLRSRLTRFVTEQSASPAVPPRRPVPAGDGVDLVAQDFYRAAARLRIPQASGQLPFDEFTVHLAWPCLEPVLMLLRAGARCERTGDNGTPNCWTAQLFRAGFSREVAAGRQEAAVALWLDWATVALDGLDALPEVLARADDAWMRGLVPEAATALERGLERLDAASVLRQCGDVPRLLADCVAGVLSRDEQIPALGRLADWRRGFDPVTADLEVLDQLRSALPSLATAPTYWPARQAQWRRFLAAAPAGELCGAWRWMHYHADGEQCRFERTTRIRLHRLALAAVRGESLPPLDDPFGGSFGITYECGGAMLRLRSAAKHAVIERCVGLD